MENYKSKRDTFKSTQKYLNVFFFEIKLKKNFNIKTKQVKNIENEKLEKTNKMTKKGLKHTKKHAKNW